MYTFGSKENGKLGHGRDNPTGSVGHVTEVTKYYDVDEQTLIPNVKIGHVSRNVLRQEDTSMNASFVSGLLWPVLHPGHH